MRKCPAVQGTLFEDAEASQRPLLQPALREKVMQLMVLWMEAVADSLDQEVKNDQDYL